MLRNGSKNVPTFPASSAFVPDPGEMALRKGKKTGRGTPRGGTKEGGRKEWGWKKEESRERKLRWSSYVIKSPRERVGKASSVLLFDFGAHKALENAPYTPAARERERDPELDRERERERKRDLHKREFYASGSHLFGV